MILTSQGLKLATLAALVTAVPVLASASFLPGEHVGTSPAEVRAALAEAGAEFIEMEIEEDEIEVTYRLAGETWEIEISPETGLVLETELEDETEDDEADDDD